MYSLKKLKKKYFLAIFTSKDKIRTLKILKRYNIFSTIITSDDVKYGKPNPEGLLKILNKVKIKKKILILLEIQYLILKLPEQQK